MNEKEQFLWEYIQRQSKALSLPIENKLIAVKQDKSIVEMRKGK